MAKTSECSSLCSMDEIGVAAFNLLIRDKMLLDLPEMKYQGGFSCMLRLNLIPMHADF
jgi:hypothetical protein